MAITIREATKDDIPDIAAIHVAGWQGAYGGLIDQDYLDSHTVENRIPLWEKRIKDVESDNGQILLAYYGDKPIGFSAYGSLRTAPPGTSKIRPTYSSEIYGLYLIPEIFRKGVGTALMKQSIENLKLQNHQSTCLWVLKDNKRACSFYEVMGGQRIGKKMVEFGTTKAKEICYGWRDINAILKKQFKERIDK